MRLVSPKKKYSLHFFKIAHSVWSNNGFLSITNSAPLLSIGSLDFAGSGVVHLTGEKSDNTACHSKYNKIISLLYIL